MYLTSVTASSPVHMIPSSKRWRIVLKKEQNTSLWTDKFGILHDVPIAIVFNNVVDGYRHENAGHQGQDQSGYFEESPNK